MPGKGGVPPAIGVLIIPFTHPRKSRLALRLTGSVRDTAGSGKRTGSERGDAPQSVLVPASPPERLGNVVYGGKGSVVLRNPVGRAPAKGAGQETQHSEGRYIA